MNKIAVRRFLRNFGVDLCRRMPRVVDLLSSIGVTKVLDVGGNIGQTGTHLRHWGYRGEITSFEPVRSAFDQLAGVSRSDPDWTAHNMAVGEFNGSISINVAARTDFSSILPALPVLESFHPGARYVAREEVEIRTIDSFLGQSAAPGDEFFLKVDTQGFEREVLAGATASLYRIRAIQLELSLVPMYDGEATFLEIANDLTAKGYRIALIEPVSYDRQSSTLFQVDTFFVRDGSS